MLDKPHGMNTICTHRDIRHFKKLKIPQQLKIPAFISGNTKHAVRFVLLLFI